MLYGNLHRIYMEPICFRELLLTGWRGAYLADLMGLEDRAKTHFNGYLNSQVIDVPVTLPHLQDTALNSHGLQKYGEPPCIVMVI